MFLANLEDDAPVPIPRWGLWKWYELNMWINDNVVNWLISLIDDSAVGYMFWGVRKMGQPRIIRVKAA